MNDNEKLYESDGENDINTPTQDDDFVIGRGFVVDDTHTKLEQEKEKNRKRRKGASTVKNIIWVVAIFAVSIGVAIGVLYVGADYLGIGFKEKECVVEIKQGSATVQIAEELQNAGAVRCPLVFRLYSKLKKFDAQYKYGVYTFSQDLGYEEIAKMLITEGAKAETVKGVQIPEMATVDDIAKILEENGVCEKADFIYEVRYGEFNYDFVEEIPADSVYYRLEGYLYPETYDFYVYDSKECAHLAIDKMLSTFEQKIGGQLREKLDSNEKYDFHDLITMASLIESEAGNAGDEDRSKVARLFFNRLEGVNWDGPKFLQTDPSTFYPYGNGRYNTYKTEGLPPGPIGSPSLRSIKAVTAPADNFEMTYFVTDKNGKFYYNDTLAGHNKIINELKAKGLWLSTTLGNG